MRLARPVNNSSLRLLTFAPHKNAMHVRVIRRTPHLVLLRVWANRSRGLTQHVTNVSRTQTSRRAFTILHNLRLRLIRIRTRIIRLISALLSLPRLVQTRLININRHTPRQIMTISRAITRLSLIRITQRRATEDRVRRFASSINTDRISVMFALTVNGLRLRVANFNIRRRNKGHINVARRRSIQRQRVTPMRTNRIRTGRRRNGNISRALNDVQLRVTNRRYTMQR